MEKDKQKRVVRIALPTGTSTHKYFSGYILGDGLIITCRHCFIPKKKGNYDPKRPIKILLNQREEKVNFTAHDLAGLCQEGRIIFESEKYDIALLRCSQVEGRFNRFLLDELGKGGGWEGGGYPYYSRDDKNTDGYKNFSGTFESVEHAAIHLTLKVTINLPHMEHWQEASGSPVFISKRLAAVLVEHGQYKDENGAVQIIARQLKAIYLNRLWYDSAEKNKEGLSFREIIEQQLIPNSSVYRERLARLLNKHSDLKNALIELLDADNDTVLELLLQLGKEDLMAKCISLQEDTNLPGVNKLLLNAMAYQYENHDCFNSQPTADKPYVQVPVVRVVACEFLMAAEDQRQPIFNRIDQSGRKEVIPGNYSITSPPEYGIDDSHGKEDIMDNLLAGRGDIKSMVERVFGDYHQAAGRTYSSDDREEVVMAILAEPEGTYYWLLEFPERKAGVKEIFDSPLPIKILKMGEVFGGGTDVDRKEEKLFSQLDKFVED